MSQSLAKNLIHLVYSTKHRQAWIPKAHQAALYRYQAGIFREWDSPALIIGGAMSRNSYEAGATMTFAASSRRDSRAMSAGSRGITID